MLPWPVSFTLVNISPFTDWPRSVFTIFASGYLAAGSLLFLKHVNSGTTMIMNPKNPLLTFKILSGHVSLTKHQKQQGFIRSYHGPFISACFGLVFFTAAQFLIVLMFKQVYYIF